MGLMLKTQRDGTLRKCWYGVYRETNGRRKVVNLNVKWDGNPPYPFQVSQPGDKDFEVTRAAAQLALDKFMEKSARKGRAEHLTERLIESKTGRAVSYALLTDLPDRWRNLGREVPASEG